LKDVSAGLAPIGIDEARYMIKNLKSYKIIQGVRGQKGVNEEMFAINNPSSPRQAEETQ